MKRPADFMGSWYPGSARACKKQIEQFLKESVELKSKNLKNKSAPTFGK